MNVTEQNSLSENPYIPKLVTVTEVVSENPPNDLKTFKLEFNNPEERKQFKYIPGQFAELSLFGVGEAPIGIASSPTEKDFLLFTVKNVGTVTGALHASKVGTVMGIRGPLGNGWPMEKMKGKNLVIIGGGFAFSTLRSLTKYILHEDNRNDFGDLTVIYGAREPGELCYKEDLKQWDSLNTLKLILTVDKGDTTWAKREGYVPSITKEEAPSPDNAYAAVCGPPIMIKFTIPVLQELGFSDDQILLSLEARMKCGIGKCGRCNVGEKFVCVDGPVFTQSELHKLPKEY